MRALTLVVAGGLLALGTPALGDPNEKGVGETAEQAMERTDKNGDGYIDRGEFHSRMVDVFYLADADKDGYLVASEYVDTQMGPFEDADRNGDGKVEMYEFMREASDAYAAADTDDDGRLSRREVEESYARDE